MADVRAKFKVTEVARYDGGIARVILMPVTGGSEENEKFWRYTPSGKVEMQIDNPDAVDRFELGAAYYVDFTKAE